MTLIPLRWRLPTSSDVGHGSRINAARFPARIVRRPSVQQEYILPRAMERHFPGRLRRFPLFDKFVVGLAAPLAAFAFRLTRLFRRCVIDRTALGRFGLDVLVVEGQEAIRKRATDVYTNPPHWLFPLLANLRAHDVL